MGSYTRTSRQRRLLIVDLENLMGAPPWTAAAARAAAREFLWAAEFNEGDHVVVACSHYAAPLLFDWPTNARFLWRSGPSGADLALVELLAEPGHDLTFGGGVVLGSGDHLFTRSVQNLRGLGLPVTVIAHAGSLSSSLAKAATTTVTLPAYELAA